MNGFKIPGWHLQGSQNDVWSPAHVAVQPRTQHFKMLMMLAGHMHLLDGMSGLPGILPPFAAGSAGFLEQPLRGSPAPSPPRAALLHSPAAMAPTTVDSRRPHACSIILGCFIVMMSAE